LLNVNKFYSPGQKNQCYLFCKLRKFVQCGKYFRSHAVPPYTSFTVIVPVPAVRTSHVELYFLPRIYLSRILRVSSIRLRQRIKLFLCLTKHYAMETYGGVDVQIHKFLTSELDGSDWSVSRPVRFTLWEKSRVIHWIGGWVGTGTVLGAVKKEKILPLP
jgi:hypothetical protein